MTVADAMWSATKARSKGAQRTRDSDGKRLVITRAPEVIRNQGGLEVGIEVHVRLFDHDGVEIPIDPVRRFINPPTELATPEGEPNVKDPAVALWTILWDSVDTAPNPEAWVP
jgi:hypothetical protein